MAELLCMYPRRLYNSPIKGISKDTSFSPMLCHRCVIVCDALEQLRSKVRDLHALNLLLHSPINKVAFTRRVWRFALIYCMVHALVVSMVTEHSGVLQTATLVIFGRILLQGQSAFNRLLVVPPSRWNHLYVNRLASVWYINKWQFYGHARDIRRLVVAVS